MTPEQSLGTMHADSYQLVRSLRTSELSDTYEATHSSRPGRFLVEVLAPAHDASPAEPSSQEGNSGWASRVEAFERELAILADAENPNITKVIGMGQLPDGRTAAIWEFPGGTLSEWLHKGRTLSGEAALALLAGVADALAAAHQRGIAHERLGLENIYLPEDTEIRAGGVKVGGFALRWLPPSGPRSLRSPPAEISADLHALAEIAERLLAPLELSTKKSAAQADESLPPAALIARARGNTPGTNFESTVQFAEALARSVRARLPLPSPSGVASFGKEEETEGGSSQRLGRVVARVGVATLATVAAVLLVGTLADRNTSRKPPEARSALGSRPAAATSVHPAVAAPARPPLPGPAVKAAPTEPPAPTRSAGQALGEKTSVTAKPLAPGMGDGTNGNASGTDEDASSSEPTRAHRTPKRGLVWSSRLQRLVTVDELKKASAP